VERRRVFRAFKTPIMLVVLVGLLVAGLWWGYHLVVTGQRPVQPSPCVTVPLAELHPQNVVVRVYNGGSERGLAGTVAKTLKQAGFIIATTGNTEEPIHDTVIVGVAADSPEVQFVASWFEKTTIRGDGRADHTVDVLVGDSGAPMNPQPPASLVIPSGQVCLPTTALATDSPSSTAPPA